MATYTAYRDNVQLQKAILQLKLPVSSQSTPIDPEQRSVNQVHWAVAISLWDD